MSRGASFLLQALGLLCGLVLMACTREPSPAAAAPVAALVVRCQGAAPMVVSIRDGKPELTSATAVPEGFRTDQRLYTPLRHERDAALPEVVQRLHIAAGELLWDQQRLALPRRLQMRNIWRATMLQGWVVGVGRSSASDAEAALLPPFFGSEVFVFRPGRPEVVLSSPLGAFPADEHSLVAVREVQLPASVVGTTPSR